MFYSPHLWVLILIPMVSCVTYEKPNYRILNKFEDFEIMTKEEVIQAMPRMDSAVIDTFSRKTVTH